MAKVEVMAKSETGGILQIRADKVDGPLLAEVKIPKGTEWVKIDSKVNDFQQGTHQLVVVSAKSDMVEVDWLRFK